MKAKITGQRLAIVFSLLFIAISLLLNLLFRTDLYVMSLNFIHHYQRSHRRELSRILNNLFSYFCSRRVLAGLTIFVMMLSKRKVMSLIYASYMMINFYFLVLLKQIFQDYRPFWTNAGVLSIQWQCSLDYGFPSYTAWMCVLAYEPLLAEMQYKQKSRFKYIILIYSAICLPLSQIYLGECSADEALFGLMMSLISTTLYHYILQRGLFLTVKKILSASTLIVGLVTLLLQIIFLSVPIVIFEVNLNTRQIPSLVSEGIAINCGRTQSSYKLQMDHEQMLALINLMFGFIYGLLLVGHWRRKEIGQLTPQQWNKYMVGQWSYQKHKFVSLLKDFVFFECILGILLLVVFFFPTLTTNMYSRYFLAIFGYTLCGFLYVAIHPVIVMKTNCITFELEMDGSVEMYEIQQIPKQNQGQQQIIEQPPPTTIHKLLPPPTQ